ncbi:MAG: NTP transferase domain-containing protein [Candidatus Omnitrophota bacterium]|jgi:bifunctional UDP-N-acetylglucosamine pyrophosphorylase/glucosamine-1-phosphate N-acetyltransferase
MKQVVAVILAAGKGTRMRSDTPKALCELAGRKMIEFLLDICRSAGTARTIVVGGYGIDALKKFLNGSDAEVIRQKRLLGSADAVKQAAARLKGFSGIVLVLYADTPLLKASTIRRMVKAHVSKNADLTLLTAVVEDAKQYGRIIRDNNGYIRGVSEFTESGDADPSLSLEINVGAYCFDAKKLFSGLNSINRNAKKNEYYLTDIVEFFYKNKFKLQACKVNDNEEAVGVNSKDDLSVADEILRRRVFERLAKGRVTIIDRSSVYISDNVRVGRGTIIYPFVVIEKDVRIGPDCKIGPFANLRKGTVLKKGSQVGNFVEVTRSIIGENSRVKHHSYIGDTLIGKYVNIGAGTITANYDGKAKNNTIIEDSAFIGSGTILVAPVKIGRRAVTGAGSVVTKGRDVASGTIVTGVPARRLYKT